MKNSLLLMTLTFLVTFSFSCKEDEEPILEKTCSEKVDALKINQLQTIGSHNSYHQLLDPTIIQLLSSPLLPVPEELSPNSLDYEHLPLEEQFSNYNVRSIELDLYNDPMGGTYANRNLFALAGLPTASGIAALDEPGLKILHIPDADFNTNYNTFKEALTTIRDWSNANPTHLPITVLVEPKEINPADIVPQLALTQIEFFDKSAIDGIDAEIKEIFGQDLANVITPDNVRGDFATLNEAVLQDNWPLLADSRGKILFFLLSSSNELELYLDGHAGLEGRVMFSRSAAGEPESAILLIDDPITNLAEIQQRVQEGYIVRTRADADTEEARTGDISRRTAAFESGAQIISTDYYKPDARNAISEAFTDYSVQLPNQVVAVVNPINGAAEASDCEVIE